MPVLARRIEAVRAFNRFYTRAIGVLGDGHLDSDLTLTEVRVLYEVAQRPGVSASEIGHAVGVDPGYLSRILAGFARRGLVARRESESDRRRVVLTLRGRGKARFAELDRRASLDVDALLGKLDEDAQRRVVDAMATVRSALDPTPGSPTKPTLRSCGPGDLGRVVERHGVLYAREYGWDVRFEALVARVVADFVDGFDAARERAWIAECDGAFAGCVFLVAEDASVAKLRLLLVEPSARGRGLGERLVRECITFARTSGYRKVRLWTNDVLVAARHIYERAGFVLVDEKRHADFGPALVGQTWELVLSAKRVPKR